MQQVLLGSENGGGGGGWLWLVGAGAPSTPLQSRALAGGSAWADRCGVCPFTCKATGVRQLVLLVSF